jgi:hypothetical protein
MKQAKTWTKATRKNGHPIPKLWIRASKTYYAQLAMFDPSKGKNVTHKVCLKTTKLSVAEEQLEKMLGDRTQGKLKVRDHGPLFKDFLPQFAKAGFRPELIFTPQGDYGKFQCATPCNDVLHDNRDLVRKLIANMDHAQLLVSETDIPRCPACGGYLERNLRRDDHFVESPYSLGDVAYQEFVKHSVNGKLLILEVGVGFNTPGIIRWPFERLTFCSPQASLIRVNLGDASVPPEIAERSISFNENADWVIHDLLRLS